MSTENDQTAPTEAAATSAPAVDSADLVRERFAAVAARAGLELDYEDVLADQAVAKLRSQSLEPTRENLAKFVADVKAQKPKLFSTAPGIANTAPPPAGPRSTPTATTAGSETAYTHWRSLREAGLKGEAEAYYQTHRRAITRSS